MMQRIKWFVLAALMAVVTLGASCPAERYSEDPAIRAKQKWAEACAVTDTVVSTATTLRLGGNLSEDEVKAVGELVDLYEPVCTGDPPAPGEGIQNIAAITAFKRLCAARVPLDETDWQLTAVEAASCAAERALLLEGGL